MWRRVSNFLKKGRSHIPEKQRQRIIAFDWWKYFANLPISEYYDKVFFYIHFFQYFWVISKIFGKNGASEKS